MDYNNEYHEDNFSAWGGGNSPPPYGEELLEPAEYKSRMGQINDLLDERLTQTKALKEAPKMLDATDALGVALCHHYQRGKPQNKTKSWQAFISENPDRIK